MLTSKKFKIQAGEGPLNYHLHTQPPKPLLPSPFNNAYLAWLGQHPQVFFHGGLSLPLLSSAGMNGGLGLVEGTISD